LIAAQNDGDDLPAFKRQDGHAVKAPPGQHPLVVDNGTVGSERGLLGFVPLVGLSGFADDTDRHLGGEPELLPDVVIDEFLKADLIGRMLPEVCFCTALQAALNLSIASRRAADCSGVGWSLTKNARFMVPDAGRGAAFLPGSKTLGFLRPYP
jgi:hypothetical protein